MLTVYADLISRITIKEFLRKSQPRVGMWLSLRKKSVNVVFERPLRTSITAVRDIVARAVMKNGSGLSQA